MIIFFQQPENSENTEKPEEVTVITKLNADDLYKRCDPKTFSFNTTEDITELSGLIGQEKALKSLDFGLGMDSDGFNIFAIGESGTGKMTTIMSMLTEKAAQESCSG